MSASRTSTGDSTARTDAPSKAAFFNLRIDVLDRQDFFRELESSLRGHKQVTVNFLNAHCFNVAQRNPEYRRVLNESSFLLNDGIGVELAGRFIGLRFPENLNGTDLIPEILATMEKDGLSAYFYGARPEVISAAVEAIRVQYPRLGIAGYSHGYEEDAEGVAARITASGADAVIVGMGVPRQELWVARNKDRLAGVKLLVCGGAIFDFLSGAVPRAPEAVRRLRLEWLFRLIREPRRLFTRYVFGNFAFFYHVLRLAGRSRDS